MMCSKIQIRSVRFEQLDWVARKSTKYTIFAASSNGHVRCISLCIKFNTFDARRARLGLKCRLTSSTNRKNFPLVVAVVSMPANCSWDGRHVGWPMVHFLSISAYFCRPASQCDDYQQSVGNEVAKSVFIFECHCPNYGLINVPVAEVLHCRIFVAATI